MPFTDAYGDKGWYTGEVASGSGLPHGQGTMHYCDGRMRGGWWSNGLAGGPPKNQRSGPPPGQHLGPPPPQHHGGGHGPPNNRSGASVSSRNTPPQQQQQQHRSPQPQSSKSNNNDGAVFNLEWTDLHGKNGYYTGEADESGEPHGLGSMRYVDGMLVEGEWYHGELERRMQNLNVGGGDDGRSVASGRSKQSRR